MTISKTQAPEEVPEGRQAGVPQLDLLLAALPHPPEEQGPEVLGPRRQDHLQQVGRSGAVFGLDLVGGDPALLDHQHHVAVLVTHVQLPDLVTEKGSVRG